jgi:hypothetical protein
VAFLQTANLPYGQAEQLRRFRLSELTLLNSVQNLESVTLSLAHLDPVSVLHAHSSVLLANWPKRTFLLR